MFKEWQISSVIPPEAIMTRISAGASTSFPKPSKRNPCPNLYRFPFSKIISPIYMSKETKTAVIEGAASDNAFLFPKVQDPTNTPIVTPSKAKKTAIKTAETGETVSSPVR